MRSSTNERGSGLLMAVFVLFLVTSVGAGLLFLTNTEVRSSQATVRSHGVRFRGITAPTKVREGSDHAGPGRLFKPANARFLIEVRPLPVSLQINNRREVTEPEFMRQVLPEDI